jgi:hypothetical protein
MADEELKAAKRMSKVLTFDEKIVSLTPPTGFDAAFIEADEYSIYINEHSSKYQSFLDRSSTTPSADTSLISSHTSTPRKVNLPKLSLTNFAGDILQWQGFKDSFDAAVHSDDSLGNIKKFQYLRKYVEGEATRAIEGLSLTNANYEDAIDILTKRYGQPHKVISAYMTALWKLEEPSGSIASLLSFHDSVESYIRGLKTLGKNEDTFGDLLVPIIIEKLPASTRRQIARDNGDDAWTIAKLRTAIRKEIEAMQAGRFMPISPCLNSAFPIPPSKNIHFAFSHFAFSYFVSSYSALFYLAFVLFRLFLFRLLLFCLCCILPLHKLPFPLTPSYQFAFVSIRHHLFRLVLIYLCPNSPSSYFAFTRLAFVFFRLCILSPLYSFAFSHHFKCRLFHSCLHLNSPLS